MGQQFRLGLPGQFWTQLYSTQMSGGQLAFG